MTETPRPPRLAATAARRTAVIGLASLAAAVSGYFAVQQLTAAARPRLHTSVSAPTPTSAAAVSVCGNVYDNGGAEEVQVSVIHTGIDCTQALKLAYTYYNHPPQVAHSSANQIKISAWTCWSRAEVTPSGNLGMCWRPDPTAGEISLDTPGATPPAYSSGPTCGTVHDNVTDELVQVTVVGGSVPCANALQIITTYLNSPPEPPQGSGGYVEIGDWSCMDSLNNDLGPGGCSLPDPKQGSIDITDPGDIPS